MLLKTKGLLILVLGLFIFAGLNYGIHHYIILPDFKNLEIAEAKKDMVRCVQELKDEIRHVDTLCHDWAAWDDLYEFAASPSTDFKKRNLNEIAILSNGLNFICITDIAGKTLFCERWGLSSEQKRVESSLPPSLLSVVDFSTLPDLGEGELADMKITGLYNSDRGPMMLSCRPIITSDHQGPVRGALVMGCLLDKESIEEMADRVELEFRFVDGNKDQLTLEEEKMIRALEIEEVQIVEQKNNDSLLVYSRLPDINGALLIRAEIPEHIFEKGRSTYTYSLVMITAIGLSMALLMIFLLRRIVLLPVTRLTDHVLEIGKSKDLSARIFFPQNDEIGVLGREVNRMLEQIEVKTMELGRVNATLETMLEKSQVGIMALSGDRVLYKGNQRLAEILGYDSPESMVGMSMRALHTSQENYIFFEKKYYNKLVHGKLIQVEYEILHKDGSPVWCTLSGKAIDPSSPPDLEKGVVWIVDDITEKRQNREKLKKLATTDFLTGLYNRSHFMELAAIELERQKRYLRRGLSLIMLDVDHFKTINDTYGHDMGDLVLKHLARICRERLRGTDIFARIGGEEFVILLPATNITGAVVMAERLRQAIEKTPLISDKKHVSITVSFGVTAWTSNVNEIASMLKHADIALYTAKQKGRNLVECHG